MSLNKLVTDYVEVASKVKEISQTYDRTIDSLDTTLVSMKDFKVTLPLVGAFSSGKSTLINTLLGERLLPVDVDPRTAVPTEIYYAHHDRILLQKGNIISEISKAELRTNPYDVDVVDKIQVELHNDWLSSLHHLKLVDLPGLESGIYAHEKAVNDYLPESMAYIISISAEDGTVRNSVLEFLKELHLLEMDVFIIITKADKVDVIEEGIYDEVQNEISKIMPNKPFDIGIISSRKKDVEHVRTFLAQLQLKASTIFQRQYREELSGELSNLESYLSIRLNQEERSLEDIDKEEHELHAKMDNIHGKMEKEKEQFEVQIDQFIETVKGRISSGLQSISDLLVEDIANQLDVQHRVQQVVRTSIFEGIKHEFEPKLQRYLHRVHEGILSDVTLNTNVQLDPAQVKVDEMTKDIVVKSIPAIVAAIGFSVGGPIGAVIGGAMAILVEMFFTSKQQDKKKELIRQKVNNEIIPSIVQKAGDEFSISLRNSIDDIHVEIEKSLEKQKNSVLDALENLRLQKQLLVEEQEKLREQIQRDLEVLKQLRLLMV